jgi:hypothetical protein
MRRTHDVVLAEGTFRVVLTAQRHVIAVLDAPHTMLGPVHIALEVDREPFLPSGADPRILRSHETGRESDHHAARRAGEGAFHEASLAAPSVAHPAFDLLRHATGEGAHRIAHAVPQLPHHARHDVHRAAHIVLRAKLGDLSAKHFMRTIAHAAKSGVESARHVADTLLDASKFVAKSVDAPVILASHMPGFGGVVKSISPLVAYQRMATALQKGDFDEMKRIAIDQLDVAQGVISLVPGVGTGISAAIGAGEAALEGGSALDVAIRTAYGAIPIPPGLRQLTDVVLDAVLSLLDHPHDLSHVAIQIARDRVPSGLPRDVFDTLIHLVAKRVPMKPGAIVDHYVHHYATVERPAPPHVRPAAPWREERPAPPVVERPAPPYEWPAEARPAPPRERWEERPAPPLERPAPPYEHPPEMRPSAPIERWEERPAPPLARPAPPEERPEPPHPASPRFVQPLHRMPA